MPLKTIAILLLAATFGARTQAAAPCEAEIQGSDAMRFDKTQLEIPARCRQFSVTLRHTGRLPAAAMGHNWVLTRSADARAVASDGLAAGSANAYVRPGDARVIAHTRLLGGGQSDTVTFDTAALKAGEDYTWFCSFPGHWAMMKGSLALRP